MSAIAGIIFLCAVMGKITDKVPIPSLFFFMIIGMVIGVDGLGYSFDDYSVSKIACTVTLAFIMFYAGFSANIKEARPVLVRSFTLASVGVAITAFLVGAFCHYLLGLGWIESLLIGSVVSSTDVASVFNVLRSSRLGLKENTASILEVESGSNDPISYSMTIVFLTLLAGKDISIPLLFLEEIGIGLLFGFGIGYLMKLIYNTYGLLSSSGRSMVLVAVALASFALPYMIGGNGFLSVYLAGIILGNGFLPEKRELVHFFEIISDISEMMIFFLLGLLVTPSKLGEVVIPAALIMVFLTIVARPIATFAVLSPFRSSVKQMTIVSLSGLRGAASIVFTLYVVLEDVILTYDIFNLVFVIVILSLALQGTFLPTLVRSLRMHDESTDIRDTFTDTISEYDVDFVWFSINEGHASIGKPLSTVVFPEEMRIMLVIREQITLIPTPYMKLREGDILVVMGNRFEGFEDLTFYEKRIHRFHRFAHKPISTISRSRRTIIMGIKRDGEKFRPKRDTVLLPGDRIMCVHYPEDWKVFLPRNPRAGLKIEEANQTDTAVAQAINQEENLAEKTTGSEIVSSPEVRNSSTDSFTPVSLIPDKS